MDPSRAPQAIGRYQVLSRLGRGAMGVVFSARDDRLGRDVAIKVMNAGLDDEPDTRARFFREAQVTSKLLHRNIVTVFDLGEDAGRPFIVMELLKGRTLGEALKESALETLESKLDLMIQLCEGLSKAHAAGVIHRDIKPNNLFILPDGSLKILDFGIARLASSQMTRTGLIVGTPDYMSPEQARGTEIDERSDLFSVAGVCYFMLTKRKPFAGPDIATSLRRVMKEDPDPLSEQEAPPPLAAVVMRGLSKEPARRYQACAEMSADLIRFRRNFDTETRRIGVLARAQFEEAIKIAGEIKALQQDSGLATAEWFEAEVTALNDRFPFYSTSNALGRTPPSRRSQLAEINAEILPIVQKLSGELKRLTAELTQRTRKVDDLAAEADAGIRSRNFDLAETRLGEARALGLAADRVMRLQTALADARLVAAAMAGAEASCARGAWGEAVAGLQAVVDKRPDLDQLRTELDRVRREHTRLSQLAAEQREAADRVREGERQLAQGDLSGAVATAERVLATIPQHEGAQRLRGEALARLEEQAQAAITAARARNQVARALQHLSAGRFDNALREAEAALQIDPDFARADAVRQQARRLLDAAAAAQASMAAARQRERDVMRLVGAARAALANGQAGSALHDAESAMARDPASEEAKLILDHVRSVLELMSGDEDDTQATAPAQDPRSAGLAGLVGRLSDRFRGRRS